MIGEAFSSTTNGGTVDDADIYITFADAILDTEVGELVEVSKSLAVSAGFRQDHHRDDLGNNSRGDQSRDRSDR